MTWPGRWQTYADFDAAQTLEEHGLNPLEDAAEGIRRGLVTLRPMLATRRPRADEWPGWDVSSGMPRGLQ